MKHPASNYDMSELEHLNFNKNIKPFNKVLSNSLKKLGIYQNILQAKIRLIFPKLIGDSNSKYINDIFITNNILYIKISSAPLRQNLLLQRNSLLATINQILNTDISDIVIF